jgi:hypothetical protein
MRTLIYLLFLLSFVSCGKEISSLIPEQKAQDIQVDSAVSEKYSYEFRTRSCSTGSHQGSTLVDICLTLKNNDLNEDCAHDEREVLFENSSCPGIF